MKRSYFARGRLVEIDQVDDLVAIRIAVDSNGRRLVDPGAFGTPVSPSAGPAIAPVRGQRKRWVVLTHPRSGIERYLLALLALCIVVGALLLRLLSAESPPMIVTVALLTLWILLGLLLLGGWALLIRPTLPGIKRLGYFCRVLLALWIVVGALLLASLSAAGLLP